MTCMCCSRSCSGGIELVLRSPSTAAEPRHCVIGSVCDGCANVIELQRNQIARVVAEAVAA